MTAESAPNLKTYQRDDVVNYYTELRGLQKSEAYLFGKYIASGAAVLDLGVGGGRTTQFLSKRASRYVGVDYSAEMVASCRKQFPSLEFHHLDAAQMTELADASFDAIVFPFNGMDYLYPAQRRQRCLSECARLLRNGGSFVFSIHNARNLLVLPQLSGVGVTKKAWRLVRSAAMTARSVATALPSRSFWGGDGFVIDPVHGGLKTHVAVQARVVAELAEHGFEFRESVSSEYSQSGGHYTAPWFYYAFVRKPR